jgi:hypothetical protein
MAASPTPLIDLKISVTLESCEALLRMLSRISLQDQMPASKHVIDAMRSAVIGLQRYLDSIRTDSTLHCLSESDIEKKVTIRSQFLPYLHRILGNIVQDDIGYIPAELAQTLRKQFQSLVPDSDVVIVSSFELNYEVIELAGDIEKILRHVSGTRPSTLPTQIYRINLPTVEYDQALLHCIIAHEFGHPLSRIHNIKNTVRQNIHPDSNFLTEIAHRIERTANKDNTEGAPKTQREFPFTEVEIRAKLTEALNRRALLHV